MWYDGGCGGDGVDTAGGSSSGKMGRVGVLLESSRVVLQLLMVFGKVGLLVVVKLMLLLRMVVVVTFIVEVELLVVFPVVVGNLSPEVIST